MEISFDCTVFVTKGRPPIEVQMIVSLTRLLFQKPSSNNRIIDRMMYEIASRNIISSLYESAAFTKLCNELLVLLKINSIITINEMIITVTTSLLSNIGNN